MFRRFAAILFVLAVLTGVVATDAFSATAADREFSVNVVDDDEAYLGYEPATVYAVNTTAQTTTETLITLTNRFSSPVELTAVEVDAHPTLEIVILEESETIRPGESIEIRAGIRCDEQIMSSDVAVSVSVDGEGVAAALDGDTETRTATVSCSP